MRRWLLMFALAMGMQGIAPTSSRAENEPHPAKAWRPLTMVDLRLVGPTRFQRPGSGMTGLRFLRKQRAPLLLPRWEAKPRWLPTS